MRRAWGQFIRNAPHWERHPPLRVRSAHDRGSKHCLDFAKLQTASGSRSETRRSRAPREEARCDDKRRARRQDVTSVCSVLGAALLKRTVKQTHSVRFIGRTSSLPSNISDRGSGFRHWTKRSRKGWYLGSQNDGRSPRRWNGPRSHCVFCRGSETRLAAGSLIGRLVLTAWAQEAIRVPSRPTSSFCSFCSSMIVCMAVVGSRHDGSRRCLAAFGQRDSSRPVQRANAMARYDDGRTLARIQVE